MYLLYYPLLAGSLLAGSLQQTAAPSIAPPGTVLSAARPADTLQQRAQAYSRYLTYALRLRGRQPAAAARCTEAFLRELAGQGPAAASGLQLRYLDAMREVLSPGQYGAFCWLQEREQAAAAVQSPSGGPNTSRR